MIVARRPDRFVWLPVVWCLVALAVVPLLWFGLSNLPAAPVPDLLGRVASLLVLALLVTAPLLGEVRTVTRMGSGAIRVRWPWGQFEAPAADSWITVRWNMKQRFVVWISPTREVKVAWAVSNRRALQLAQQAAAILDLPHRVDPAVADAARQEAKSWRLARILFPVLLIGALLVAGLLQYLMLHR